MLFNSVEFILFLAAVVLASYAVPIRYKKYYLLAVSYAFYFSWSVPHAVLLLVCTAVAYACALGIEAGGTEVKKKLVLSGALVVLLINLVFFKYGNLIGRFFGLESGARILNGKTPLVSWMVPVGISYYTFKLLSYLIDVYWEKTKPEKDFAAFAAYVVFFPQILSGPIQRAIDFLPQIRKYQEPASAMIVSGLRLILFGFFKKLVIADRLSILTDRVFASPGDFNSTAIWLAGVCFYIQLYADFSGLTDIAIGAGRLLGIRSPQNFNAPLAAVSIQDFWRRWHITLTSWVTDYLFMPLRMAFRHWGSIGLVLCIFINMMVIALWHGWSAAFVAFGLVQGILMTVSVLTLKARNRFFEKHPFLKGLRRFTAPLVTFHLIAGSLIFVKAGSLGRALAMFGGLARMDFTVCQLHAGLGRQDLLKVAIAVIVMEVFGRAWFFEENQQRFNGQPQVCRLAAYYFLTFFTLYCGVFSSNAFIYFRF